MVKESGWLPTNPYKSGVTTALNPNYKIYETAKMVIAKRIAERLQKIFDNPERDVLETHWDIKHAIDSLFKEIEES